METNKIREGMSEKKRKNDRAYQRKTDRKEREQEQTSDGKRVEESKKRKERQTNKQTRVQDKDGDALSYTQYHEPFLF